jgi:hypothetical protein
MASQDAGVAKTLTVPRGELVSRSADVRAGRRPVDDELFETGACRLRAKTSSVINPSHSRVNARLARQQGWCRFVTNDMRVPTLIGSLTSTNPVPEPGDFAEATFGLATPSSHLSSRRESATLPAKSLLARRERRCVAVRSISCYRLALVCAPNVLRAEDLEARHRGSLSGTPSTRAETSARRISPSCIIMSRRPGAS